MQYPILSDSVRIDAETFALPGWLPIPGLGLLPLNAFLIRGAEPVLVDTGLGALGEPFLAALGSLIDPDELRWVYLTHTDADHVGNLERILQAAPRARVVTTFLGMGKMSLHRPLAPERVFLLNPGQHLDVPGHRLRVLQPPTFDAPETTAVFDETTRVLFSSDAFGALLGAPVESAREIPADELREGVVRWAGIDAPWLRGVNRRAFRRALEAVVRLEPSVVLSSHLPPARSLTRTLVRHLATVPSASPFVGPDQAALQQMMAA